MCYEAILDLTTCLQRFVRSITGTHRYCPSFDATSLSLFDRGEAGIAEMSNHVRDVYTFSRGWRRYSPLLQDHPTVERPDRAVVVRKAVITWELGDDLVQMINRCLTDEDRLSQHEPADPFTARRRGQ